MTLGAHFILAEGIVHVRQPESAIAAARGDAARRSLVDRGTARGHDADRLGAAGAGAARAGCVDPEQVWAAAHVDEDWNIEKWGVDEEVAARRAARLVDFRPPPAS